MASKILVRLAGSNISSAPRYPAGSPLSVTSSILIQSRNASSSPKQPATVKANAAATTSTTGQVKRESLKSKLAAFYGGYIDPADPNDPPIPASKVNFPDVTDQATGPEKLLLLAFENGILDPYCNLPVQRNGRGSRDNPVIIESFENTRMVACVCEPSQNHHNYMHLHMGEPKRCQCGHWFELVEAPRFWEKIPKEDLVQIPWFKDLEDEGKLDKYLETGKLD